MALPVGVTTVPVIAGVPVTHTGAAVKAFVSIEPSAFLVHAATGTPLVDFLEELDISEGTSGQFILPHTDQAGFEDGAGNAYTNWYYTARITYSTPSKAKTKAPKVKVFQLLSGQTDPVDLDKLPEGAPALPYSAPTAKVDAFMGRTGAVTLLDADLPERLSETELSATYVRPTVLGTAVLLGDSISQRNGSGPIPNNGETATYHRAMGYFSWANLLGGKKLRMVRNAGVGGDNTTQILARVDTDVIPYQPGWCFVLCGVNDGLTDMPASQSISNLAAIYDKLSAAGIRIVAMTPWPGSTSTTAQRTELFKVSEWIRAQQQVRKNFTMVDTAAVFIDPATGYPPASYASDFLHPDPDGAAVLGRAVAAAMEPQLAGVSSGLIVSNDDINVITNGMFTGNSAGTSTGWGYESLGGVHTPTKVAKAGGLGEWQQVTCVSGTTGLNKTSTTGFVAGTDVLYADCLFEADDDWASVKFELSLEYSGAGIAAGAVIRAADMLKANGDVASTTIPRQGVLRTPQLLVPAGTTTVKWALRFEGSGTFRVSRASIRKA